MNDYVIINGELYHHGVKGQKWGVRRYQNKDGSLTPAGKKRVSNKQIREEKRKIQSEEYDRLEKKHGLSEKYDEIIKFGEKHGLDLDDGGGGDSEAGAKYMKMWEDWEDLDDRIRAQSAKKGADYVINTYGEKKLKSLQRADNAKTAAVVAAMPIMLVTLPVWGPAMAIGGAVKNSVKKKKEQKQVEGTKR